MSVLFFLGGGGGVGAGESLWGRVRAFQGPSLTSLKSRLFLLERKFEGYQRLTGSAR